MRTAIPAARSVRRGWLTDLLTLDRDMGLEVVQLIYWGGLAVVALFCFGVVGAAVGLLLRSGLPEGLLTGLPLLVAGLAAAGVLGLLWRGACEFFVAVFQIADDLRAIRELGETPPPSPPAPRV